MQYFDELTDVEQEIIRLGELKKLVTVLVNGAETSDEDDVRASLNYIQGSLDDIHDNLSVRFEELFNLIADASPDETDDDEDGENEESDDIFISSSNDNYDDTADDIYEESYETYRPKVRYENYNYMSDDEDDEDKEEKKNKKRKKAH